MKDPNERRALLAIALCIAVFYGWSLFFAPPPAEPTAAGPVVAETAGGAPVSAGPGVSAGVPATGTPAVAASEGPCVPGSQTVRTEIAELTVDACGRGVSSVGFPVWNTAAQVTPWWTWVWNAVSGKGGGGWTPYVLPSGNQNLLSDKGSFALAGQGVVAGGGTWTLTPAGKGVQAQRTTAEGLSITEVIQPTDAKDVLDLTITFSAERTLTGPLWVGIADSLTDVSGRFGTNPWLAAVVDGDLEQQQKPSNVTTDVSLPGPVSWIGVEDRYFLAALQPKDPTWGTARWTHLADGRTGVVFAKDLATVSPGAPVQVQFKVYVGPKEVERLAVLGNGLEEAVDLGMFGLFSKVLLFFLGIFHAGVKNWGVSILLLTFLVRVIFYPLTASAFKSGKKMQAVQPKLKELQERYADDKESLNRETMKLFAKHQVNPLGGCLPMLVQMPIFFALYSALMHTPALFHAEFAYLHDLSAPDPYGVLPALMAVGMVVQQRLTPMSPGMDPAQAQMMKFMPLLFAVFMFNVPAGLSLYYSTNTLLSIAQQWYNTRNFQPIVLDDEA